ncbi:gamma-soluble NSF attachment protein isoform X2 [Hydra vulgaris]|uniref:gamma-soluble NSF attachment protein isoform X2 n=1 Tax=Hydra vulgaris TaxID=6087 RepID=UPI0032EA3FBF
MSSSMQKALNHVKEAEKALKTSLFKWTPDFDTAANEYTKAATSFKSASSMEQAKECYIKAADMHEKLNSLLVQAAGIANELKQSNITIELMERACILYQQHGALDTAALTLVKAGKMCESTLPNKAVEFFIKASELCENEGKLRDASDYINQAIRIQVKQKLFFESTNLMKRRLEIIEAIKDPSMAYSVILCMVIVFLTEGDFVAANNSLIEGFNIEGFGLSDEAKYSENLIKSFQDGDKEMLKFTQNQATVTHLDVEIARLAKLLKIPEEKIFAEKSYDREIENVHNVGKSENKILSNVEESQDKKLTDVEESEFKNILNVRESKDVNIEDVGESKDLNVEDVGESKDKNTDDNCLDYEGDLC